MDAPIPTPFYFQPIETYKCALVCALALLGRSRIGWYTPDSFPPILSKIVKLARFMVLDSDLVSSLDDPEYRFAYEDEGYQSLASSMIPSSPNSSSPSPLALS
ncbi:unnamed protein product [Penicillium salamii]|nr:unnamed protein product [Penicillium salamii]